MKETSWTTWSIINIWVPKGEERVRADNLSEGIVTENLPKLGKETHIEVQEAQKISNKINPERATPRNIEIKMAKIEDKERILKAERGITYKGTPINWFFSRMLTRREWNAIFKVMKGKNLHPRILYLARLSFRFDGEIKRILQTNKSLKCSAPPN